MAGSQSRLGPRDVTIAESMRMKDGVAGAREWLPSARRGVRRLRLCQSARQRAQDALARPDAGLLADLKYAGLL